jgi:hypothetical protein
MMAANSLRGGAGCGERIMESRSPLCKTALIIFCLVAYELVAQAQGPDLSPLSSDDRLSVELACVIDKGNGPAPYHACLQRQLGTMSGSRSLDLSGLNATTTVPSPITSGTRLCAENGSCYGDLNANGVPKTVHVNGYYRKDGTYVRGHYRSAPGTNPSKSK